MLFKILLPLSFLVLLVSFWNRDTLSEDILVLDSLHQEPKQIVTDEAEFSLTIDNINYQIQPQYHYDLYGLVVSYRHHNSKFGLHKLWQDHLNVTDLCVVWGENVLSAELHKLDFWNGQFTCNVKTGDTQAWNSFDMFKISNNHLLTHDEFIRNQLEEINIGDQIRIEGWLASYSNDQGGFRGTSITRKDTGNGACETIYVNNVEILRAYSNGWRKLMILSLITSLALLIGYIAAPIKART